MEYIQMRISLFFILMALALNTFSATKESTEGKITEVSIYLEAHNDSTARGMVQVKMDTPMEENCKGFYFDQSETVAVSSLLSAKARDARIKVYYFTNQGAPWNDSMCKLYTFLEK